MAGRPHKLAGVPEGHVIHRLARELNAGFTDGALEVSSPQGRFSAEAALLDGHRIARAEAVGKHLPDTVVDASVQLLARHVNADLHDVEIALATPPSPQAGVGQSGLQADLQCPNDARRVAAVDRAAEAACEALLADVCPQGLPVWPVEGLALVESRLLAAGAEHRVRMRYAFGGGNSVASG